MHFGFSYIGLIFLIMLFVPNGFFAKYHPQEYEQYAKNENRVLLILERIGQVLVTTLVLIFRDFNVRGLSLWLVWLIIALLFMLLYEGFWIRYFTSSRTMQDFYRSFCKIPLAGATLPVAAVLCIAVYGGNPFLLIAGIILGIGHIGIHWQHQKEIFGQSFQYSEIDTNNKP